MCNCCQVLEKNPEQYKRTFVIDAEEENGRATET